jgi:hypothetical protein
LVTGEGAGASVFVNGVLLDVPTPTRFERTCRNGVIGKSAACNPASWFALKPDETVMNLFPSVARLAAVAASALLLVACGPRDDVDLRAPTEMMSFAPSEDADQSAASAPQPVQLAQAPQATVTPANQKGKRQKVEQVDPNALSSTYYIEFRARSAQSYGHTFVALGQLKNNGEIGSMEIAGLHPATESSIPWMIGHVFPVPSETGASDGDTEEQYIIARHRITMDKARFDRLMRFVRDLQKNSPAWHAVLYNCNAFVGDIAKHMGLTPPDNPLYYPQDYIERLARLNRNRTEG